MDQQPPISTDPAAPEAPSPAQRIAGAADDIKHEAQALYAKAATAAEQAIDRLDDAASDVREQATQAGENVIDELRGIGSRLAAALQAAAATPEAESLKGDIREGAQRLVNELQAAIKASPIGRMGGRPDAADDAAAPSPATAADPAVTPPVQRVAATVRTELASALRSLNRALDRLAGQLAPSEAVVDAAPAPDPSSTDAPSA